jgi:hypothetical protein
MSLFASIGFLVGLWEKLASRRADNREHKEQTLPEMKIAGETSLEEKVLHKG